MTISYAKFFAPTVLPITTPTTLLTIPSTSTSILLRGARIRLTNYSAVAATATLYAVPAAGSSAGVNTFFPTKSIAANDYVDVDVPIMGPGEFIQGMAGTATSINAQIISGSYFS